MIQLHVVVYEAGGSTWFKVFMPQINGGEMGLTEVTGHYDVVAVETEDGRKGFSVIPK